MNDRTMRDLSISASPTDLAGFAEFLLSCIDSWVALASQELIASILTYLGQVIATSSPSLVCGMRSVLFVSPLGVRSGTTGAIFAKSARSPCNGRSRLGKDAGFYSLATDARLRAEPAFFVTNRNPDLWEGAPQGEGRDRVLPPSSSNSRRE